MKFHPTLVGVAALAAALVPAAAHAVITVDGTYDADYGAAKSQVLFTTGTPAAGDFATGSNQYSAFAAYSIYLASDSSNVYGFLQADRATGLNFANLYFNVDPHTPGDSGSDIGFELGSSTTQGNAFVPGRAGGTIVPLQFAVNAAGTAIEFSIPVTYFTAPIGGLNYYSDTTFGGPTLQLRASQSFGYSYNGGSSYGETRLGEVAIGGAVPEPASWAMMIGGFGLMGAAMRRRGRTLVTAR